MSHKEPRRFEIEMYFAGEMDTAAAADLENHFNCCKVCFSYLQNLRLEKNEFLADHPFSSVFAPQPGRKSLPWYRIFQIKTASPKLVPIFGLLLLLISFPVLYKMNTYKQEIVRFKGSTVLSFLYNRQGKIGEGNVSDVFYAGDRIQILYNSSKEQYMALLSVDSRGTVSFYHSDTNSPFCTVKSGTGSALMFPGSIVLDNAGDGELIIALFSPEPLKTESVEKWITAVFKSKPVLSKLNKALEKSAFSSKSEIATLLLRKG